jgi:drug/metabolite transporter (DMT)-like permease
VKHRVWGALALASLGWGTAGIASRAALQEGLGPYQITAIRASIATGAVLILLTAMRRPLAIDRRRWLLGLVLGSMNMAIPLVLTTVAVQYASAGFVGLLVANIPVGTALWANWLLPAERLTFPKAAGLAVSVSGILLLMAGGDSGLGDEGNPLLAVVLSTIGLACASYGSVHVKRHAPDLGALDLAAPQFAVGAAIMVPLMALTEGVPADATATGWVLLVYLGVAGTVLPFSLFYWSLRSISATEASLVGYVVPIVGLAGGAMMLSEHVTPVILMGGALILAGVLITQRAAHVAPHPAPGAAAER